MTNIEHQTAAANRGASLARTTFKTSRLLDFCSERELVKQIGHGVDHWPLVILKELLDNAIDAAEEANTVPVIGIKVATGEITITDNGPGIPAESITGILDFSVQVSSREAYASPTRGAQGNALKTIVAMAFALDGTKGETVIESQGITHRITFRVDQVRQEPKTEHIREPSSIKKGTRVTVRWPVCASSKLDQAKPHFLQMASDFGWLNPHLATLSVTWNGQASVDFKASDRAWSKWRPSDPTSPHWYDARLRRLTGAYIARDHDHGHDLRTVREFISEFRGLSASAKQKLVLEAAGAARLCCEELGDPVIVDPITVAEELGERKLAAEMCAPLCTRRYSFLNKVELQHPWRAASRYVASARSRSSSCTISTSLEVIDLGLRREDVRRLDLQSESAFDKGNDRNRRENLLQNGATTGEAEYLLRRRVELNAMTSGQPVTFIEYKLKQHGVKKIVLERETLDEAFTQFVRNREIEKIVKRELEKRNGNANAKPPADLGARVRQYLEEHPQARWDEAVNQMVETQNR